VGTPSPPTNLPSRAPKNASGFARDLWMQGIGERIQLMLDPSSENAAMFIRAGIESFDAVQLRHYIDTDGDLIPVLREWMELDHALVRPWAQTVLRIWWPQVFAAAMDPQQLLADIRLHDPDKGRVLDTPKGRIWFNATVYNLITYFRAYAKIEGNGTIEPPPNLPERLKRKALQGAGAVMAKVQNR
jgi:hypothetical protein